MQKGKKFVTFAIRVRTMWYAEKVSNFEIAVAKLKKTLRNIKFATLCRSVAYAQVCGVKVFYYDQNTIPFIHTYSNLAYLLYLVNTHQCTVLYVARKK